LQVKPWRLVKSYHASITSQPRLTSHDFFSILHQISDHSTVFIHIIFSETKPRFTQSPRLK